MDGSAYIIEKGQPGQQGALQAIEHAAAALFPEADLPASLRYRVTDHADLDVAIRNGRLWSALDRDGSPVGFALATVVDDQAHLDEINVHPDHGQRGIGARLVQAVIDWARESGFESVSLVTFRHLPWNGPFYARFGFADIARQSLGPELKYLLDKDVEVGLDPGNRVAMRLML